MRDQQNSAKESNRSSYDANIEKNTNKIIDLIDDFMKLDNSQYQDFKNAYVVFRSMEGAARVRSAFSTYTCTRVFSKCCCRKRWEKNTGRKYFLGKWLDIKEACDPSIILWENLGYSDCNRLIRTLFVILISAGLVFSTLIGIFYTREWDKSLKESANVGIECTNFVISEEAAVADSNLDEDSI
jgi:hypothetical protein